MKTIYLIWKDPACNGISPDWQKITGKEFLALMRSPKGKGRHFIRLQSHDHEIGDAQIVMETTKTAYSDWKREKNHADYLQKHSVDWRVISYHAMGSATEDCTGEEMLPDENSNFEVGVIKSHGLKTALASLTDEERHLVEHLYLMDKPGTVRSYEESTGIPKSTVSRRHKTVLEKLKKFFES